MMRKNRVRLVLGALLVAAWTLYAASPALYLVIFRVRHPASRKIEFSGFQFSTPYRWIPIGDTRSVLIMRQPLWIFGASVQETIFLDANLRGLKDVTPEEFFASAERVFKRSGLVKSDERELVVAGEKVICVEGRRKEAPDSATAVNCFFLSSHEVASFNGDLRYAGVFYNLLSGFSNIPPGSDRRVDK
jgi:hypothetical protein